MSWGFWVVVEIILFVWLVVAIVVSVWLGPRLKRAHEQQTREPK